MTLSQNTQRAYDQARRDFEATMNVLVGAATEAELHRYGDALAARGLSVSTIKLRLGVLGKAMGYEVTVMGQKSSSDELSKYLSAEQVRALLAAIPQGKKGDFAIICTLLLTGLRHAEICNWRWEDFGQFGVTYVTVRGKQWVISDELMAVLESVKFRPEQNPVFLGVDSLSTLKRHLRSYARLAGLDEQDVSLETLRRTHEKLDGEMGGLVRAALFCRTAAEERLLVRWKKKDVRLHGIGRRSK